MRHRMIGYPKRDHNFDSHPCVFGASTFPKTTLKPRLFDHMALSFPYWMVLLAE